MVRNGELRISILFFFLKSINSTDESSKVSKLRKWNTPETARTASRAFREPTPQFAFYSIFNLIPNYITEVIAHL